MFAADLVNRKVSSNLEKRRANVESLRMQSKESLRRVVVIKAFIALRLLQLKEIAQNRDEEKIIGCEVLLSSVVARWRRDSCEVWLIKKSS